MPRRLLAPRLTVVVVLAGLLVPTAGCEQRRFDAAVSRDTQDAYRAFLARHGEGTHAAQARRRLEILRWREARDGTSIYALRRYLADYPDGRFVAEARRRLAEARLRRARGAGDTTALRRLLETAPDEAFAREARAELERRELAAALRRGDEASLTAFLDEFPDGAGAARARDALRALQFAAAGDDLDALERIVARYPGTAEAAAAHRRLATVEARRVRAAGEGAGPALERFARRFPNAPELAGLRAEWARIALRCAEAWTDADGVDRWLAHHGADPAASAVRVRLRALRQALRRDRTLAPKARRLLDEALPYRPPVPLAELRRRALGGELEAARAAVARLAYAPEPDAVPLLLDLATGPELVVAAQAADTLVAVCRRRGREACQTALAGAHLARPGEPVGLRQALLRLVAGDEAGALAALAETTVAGERQGRARVLPTVLLARLRERLGPADAAGSAVERAVDELGALLAALERLFPVELVPERRPEALLAARTGAALLRLCDSLGAPAAALRARLATRVADWEGRLTATVPGFVPAAADPLAAELAGYATRRAAALAALQALARRVPVARPALEAARAGSPTLRLCPGAPPVPAGALGVGPRSRHAP